MQPYGALDCFGWRSEGGAGGNEGKTQGGLPLGNPVCLWQTELFKLNLKSSPSSSGYNRRSRLATGRSGKQQAKRTAVRAAPIVCPEESPLLAATHDNSVIRETITGGLDAPTTARVGTCHLMGFSPTFGARRFPKGNRGKRVPSGHNRRRRLAPQSSGKQQAERTAVRAAPIVCPEESPLVRPQAHISCRGGLTRRLRRGRWGCRPEGGSTFFRSERKYQRKHAARRLRRRHTSLCAVGFGLR